MSTTDEQRLRVLRDRIAPILSDEEFDWISGAIAALAQQAPTPAEVGEPLREALQEVQEMWNLLDKHGVHETLMRRYSRALFSIEDALAAALTRQAAAPAIPNLGKTS